MFLKSFMINENVPVQVEEGSLADRAIVVEAHLMPLVVEDATGDRMTLQPNAIDLKLWRKHFGKHAQEALTFARKHWAKYPDPAGLGDGGMLEGDDVPKGTTYSVRYDTNCNEVVYAVTFPTGYITSQATLETAIEPIGSCFGDAAADTWMEGDLSLFSYDDVAQWVHSKVGDIEYTFDFDLRSIRVTGSIDDIPACHKRYLECRAKRGPPRPEVDWYGCPPCGSGGSLDPRARAHSSTEVKERDLNEFHAWQERQAQQWIGKPKPAQQELDRVFIESPRVIHSGDVISEEFIARRTNIKLDAKKRVVRFWRG